MEDSVILNALREIGPYRLMQWVKTKDHSISFKSKYYNLCEMCNDLTSNLDAVQVLRQNLYELFHIVKYVRQAKENAKSANEKKSNSTVQIK